MINIKDLMKNKEFYITEFEKKGFSLRKEVEEVLNLYDVYLELLKEEINKRRILKEYSTSLNRDNINDSILDKAKKLSNEIKDITIEVKKRWKIIDYKMSFFPQISSSETPIGKDQTDNVVIKEFGKIKNDNSKPHWEVLEDKGQILLKESRFISGSRHVIYKDKVAELAKALERLMLDEHRKAKYMMIEPPVIVNAESLYNTGQLPKFENDLFKLENGQYLIPTAEVPLTNIADKRIFKENELPIKLMGSTQCFRSEAGSAGKDTRGIIRLHQFRKVELVKFGKPKNEKEDFNEMLYQASKILDILEIPYRHLLLCTGDLSFASKKTIDIEVWMPGQKRWLEISSVSCMGDFQSRRMDAKVKINNNNELIYTYNGSALAIGRTIAAIIENYYSLEDNIVKVPNALSAYLSFKEI